jgi:hypothetical protein
VKAIALLVVVAKSAVLFTAGRFLLHGLAGWFPNQFQVLQIATGIGLAAIWIFVIVPPFIRAVDEAKVDGEAE